MLLMQQKDGCLMSENFAKGEGRFLPHQLKINKYTWKLAHFVTSGVFLALIKT